MTAIRGASRFWLLVIFGAPTFVASISAASVAEAQAPERIAEIRVHGNHTTPDADVLALSGLHVGDAATEERLREAGARIRASQRFDDVEVRRRYLSIADPTQIVVIILVDEKAGVSQEDLTPGVGKRIRAAGMWLPILNYADGYGFTYGVRMAFANPVGANTRLTVPMSWGGERRAGVEVEKNFRRGGSAGSTGLAEPHGGDAASTEPAAAAQLLTIRGGAAVYRRVNPFYDQSDVRLEARVRAEHAFTPWLRAGGETRLAQVTFGGVDEGRHDLEGADLTIDTRLDPSFPRNAVLAILGIERVGFQPFQTAPASGNNSAVRRRADLRGYIGVVGSTVVVVRGQFINANAPLPPSEQSLLGGIDSLRGYRAGHRAGDNLMAFSAEIRQPMNSPLSVGRFGVRAFVDEGTVWRNGERWRDASFDRGIGGGIYFGGGPVIGSVDVGWPRTGSPRVHFAFGVSF